MNPLEIIINLMKAQLIADGERWKATQDKEAMRDCLAVIQAINVLEDRLYNREITDITYIL